MNVIQAPKWLIERMEKLKTLPPPTLEEVKIQLKASADFALNGNYGLANNEVYRSSDVVPESLYKIRLHLED